MNYKQTMEYLEEKAPLGSVPGLDAIIELCRRLGDPQDRLSFIHVAGTNGKGSTQAYLARILRAQGYTVGQYTSPAVLEYRERYLINGKKITGAEFAEAMTLVAEAADAMEAEGLPHPTVFEMETAAAFLFFFKKECDLVLLECGMGGALDATNLVKTTKLCVFTSISMDHMSFLGNTLSAITETKAGILKPGIPAVSLWQEPEAEEVLRACFRKTNEAERLNPGLVILDRVQLKKSKTYAEKQTFTFLPQRIITATDKYSGFWEDEDGNRTYQYPAGEQFLFPFKDLTITQMGGYQIENASLAVQAAVILNEIGYPVSEKSIRKGLQAMTWPGRFEKVCDKPLIILDGAHNEDAAVKLASSIRSTLAGRKTVYIIGVLKDKEYEKMLAETYAYAEHILTLTPPENPRALSAHELAEAARQYHPNVTECGSVEEALELAKLLIYGEKKSAIVCFGSLSWLGRMRKLLK